MNLNEFAKEIHANACDKGFWDEPRPFDELCALMISELAEALEEARAGRPMEWYMSVHDILCRCVDPKKCLLDEPYCKPEGIAVEMADCAIRIMDYLGSVEYPIDAEPERMFLEEYKELSGVFMCATKHIVTASEMCGAGGADGVGGAGDLVEALENILSWFAANELDFEAIARRKHEYNKTRERLHGKLF